MTTKDIEDELVTQITTLKDDDEAALFDRVESLSQSEYRDNLKTDESAIALVGFLEDNTTGYMPRLVVEETYTVTVISKKKGTDTASTPHVLCEAVRDLIHGKQFGNTDIMPFSYEGRKLVHYDGEYIAYEMRFTTNNILHVPSMT